MKTIKKVLLYLLFAWLVCANNKEIFASDAINKAAEAIAIGYIVESPTENGKDIFIQLGNEADVFSEVIIAAEYNGEISAYPADEMIQNVVAFHMEKDVSLISISGTVNGVAFTSDLKVLDETQGEEIFAGSSEAEIAIEDYVVCNVGEEGEALTEAAADIAGNVSATMTRSRTKTEYVVVIDPGHSVKSPGVNKIWDGVLYREEVISMKIARYLIEELDQYPGVRIYLTRDENTHRDIEERVKYAQSVNADLLVSIHLNATSKEYDSASGVLAIVAKIGTYNVQNAQSGQELGREILDELVALGFKDRGFSIQMGSERYPDGSRADYFGIVRCGQMYNVPSIIVEHGFLNNENDFRKYLSTEAGIKSLGVADATGIANYLGLRKDAQYGWKIMDGKTYYYGPNGNPVTGTPIIDGKKYWFDANGEQRTGWLYLLDWKMYFDPETGEASIGMKDINGKRYLFNNDGVMQNYAGTPIINGKKYWFSTDDASLKTGWLYLLNWKLYFDPETYEAKIGMADIDGKRYLFNEDGVMQNYAGTTVINGKKYWFSTDDASLKTGWLKLGNWMLYFDPETYAAAIGEAAVNGKTCIFDGNGVLLQGFVTYGGNTYYYKNGTYLTGTQVIDGITYKFNSDGTLMQTETPSYLTMTDPANGKTYKLEPQFETDPVVDEEKLLAAVIYTESGDHSLAGQIATGLVVLNRMNAADYPDTMRYVVYQRSQYAVVRSGILAKYLNAYIKNDAELLEDLQTAEQAAKMALKIMEGYKNNGTKRQVPGLTLPEGKDDFNYMGFMTVGAFERIGLDPAASEAFQIDSSMFFVNWVLKESI